jgi:SAM-dependent methyltransferase
MLAVYAFTLFVSALLLFLIEPMVGKMTLPLLGGTPAVWNTCMLFFQGALLAGYAYAHFSTKWLGERRQAVVHMAVLLTPFLVLPITIDKSWAPESEGNPVPHVLLLLTVTVGLPFLVISTSASVLQKWFAATDHPSARDPYFLYAASNFGSMLALVIYPALVEPYLKLKEQNMAWVAGYAVLVTLSVACAWFMWRSPEPSPAPVSPQRKQTPAVSDEPLTLWQRLHWIALAAVPSSLMLGATTYITTDIAAIPLLWVIPLGIYLLSFILVFSRLPPIVHRAMVLILPLVVLMLLFLELSNIKINFVPTWGRVLMHVGVLFIVSMVCHGELARRRPGTRYLTEYFLLMSVGGVLGGLFNAIVAPLVFWGLAEYQIAMVGACLLLPPIAQTDRGLFDGLADREPKAIRRLILDLCLPLVVGGLSALLIWKIPRLESSTIDLRAWADKIHIAKDKVTAILMFGLPAIICYVFVDRSLRFGLCVGALLLANLLCGSFESDELLHTRSFFGVLTVRGEDEAGTDELGQKTYEFHRLVHGTTLHGKQFRAEDKRRLPLTYYHLTGPVGLVWKAYGDEVTKKWDVAFVGLGTGSLSAYGEPGQNVTFYEIDRAVVRISTDPRYFTYFDDAKKRGVNIKLVMGDARLKLAQADENQYDFIAVDAFSSDAIPIHLITREAVEKFITKLKEDGIIAYHISNRYLDLEPVLANIADDVGLAALLMSDSEDEEKYPGKTASTWVMMKKLKPGVEQDPRVKALRWRTDVDPDDKEKKKWFLYEGNRKLPESQKDKLLDELDKPEKDFYQAYFGKLADDLIREPRAPGKWQPLWWDRNPSVGVWTDDYSNLLRVFRW